MRSEFVLNWPVWFIPLCTDFLHSDWLTGVVHETMDHTFKPCHCNWTPCLTASHTHSLHLLMTHTVRQGVAQAMPNTKMRLFQGKNKSILPWSETSCTLHPETYTGQDLTWFKTNVPEWRCFIVCKCPNDSLCYVNSFFKNHAAY